MARDPADIDVDVLIVGAGPTGLTLAAQLRALGVRSRIIDRAPTAVHESRALVMQPRTVEMLDGLGLSAAFIAAGKAGRELHLHSGPRETVVPLFDTGLDDTAYPFLLFISQAETERLLNDHLAGLGVTVERSTSLISVVENTATYVRGAVRSPSGAEETVVARYVVGCDGAHSTVREAAGIPFEGASYPHTFMLGDVCADGVRPDVVHVHVGAPGMLFLFPLDDPAPWRVVGVHGPGQVPRSLDLATLQEAVDRFAGGTVRLHDPAWLSYFRLQHRLARHYRRGRCFLAGDAAHVHSPAGAQGMNTGMQDAWNLAWKLALAVRGLGGARLIDSYESERRPIGAFVVRASDRAYWASTSQRWPARVARQQIIPRLAPWATRFTPGRRRAFRTIADLTHRYGGPVNTEGRPRLLAGPRPGARLPDGSVTVDGVQRRLYQLLDSGSMHLLLCGPVGEWDEPRLAGLLAAHTGLLCVNRISAEPARAAVHDSTGLVLHRLGVRRSAQYLIRPDNHVGFRCAGTDLAALEQYLAGLLEPGRRS
jgi:2-polyprenyl-6-methoxyphenol hydroxylase-like FAD-dependent oxidoreductase